MKLRFPVKKVMPYVMGACLLTLVAACGSDDDNDNNSSNAPQQEQEEEGRYQVTFTPINTDVAGNVAGTGTFSFLGDDVEMEMAVDGSPAFVQHIQHIHTGSACPTMANDTNADGFVDVVEASSVSGDILIPLDSNIETQRAGMTDYPTASTNGSYRWTETTSLTLLLADLMMPDTNTEDNLVKLPVGDRLNLAGKVVEIHGVSPSADLPATVQTEDGLPAHRTLPIACGVITRVEIEEDTTEGETDALDPI